MDNLSLTICNEFHLSELSFVSSSEFSTLNSFSVTDFELFIVFIEEIICRGEFSVHFFPTETLWTMFARQIPHKYSIKCF